MLNVLWWVEIAGGLALVFDTLQPLCKLGDRDMNYDLYTSSSIFRMN